LRVADAVLAAQACVELSVKAALTLLDIPFEKSHGWDEAQMKEMAKIIVGRKVPARLKERYLDSSIRLPRLLFLVNFWSEFYLRAKYGFEECHLAPAQELFDKPDAELAVAHAEECYQAGRTLANIAEEDLAKLSSK